MVSNDVSGFPFQETTVAVVKGKESYEALQISFSKIFRDVNEIVKAGHIDIDGKEVHVEMHLGGDYKVKCRYCIHLRTFL